MVGIAIDEKLSFKYHINLVKSKLNSANFILARSGSFLPQVVRVLVYNALVKSVLEFGIWIYGHCVKTVIDDPFRLQKIVRNVAGVSRRVHTNESNVRLGFLKVPELIKYNANIIGWNIRHDKAQKNFCDSYEKNSSVKITRSATDLNFKVPFCKSQKMALYQKCGMKWQVK